jgi:hypothetical protein
MCQFCGRQPTKIEEIMDLSVDIFQLTLRSSSLKIYFNVE